MATLLTTEPLELDLPTSLGPEVRRGTAAILVPLDHPVSELLIAEEARFFEEAPVLFDVDRAEELFTFLVVTVDGAARHVVRLSAPALLPACDLLPFFLTDLIEADPDLSIAIVRDYYAELNTRIDQLISVETQFRLGDQLEPVRSADLAYLALFTVVQQHGLRGVLAHLNRPAISSFKRVGLDWHPFAGRIDLRTPTVNADGSPGFDVDYQPVCLPWDTNVELLRGLAPLTPPLYRLSVQGRDR
jgi:hypothetical protein